MEPTVMKCIANLVFVDNSVEFETTKENFREDCIKASHGFSAVIYQRDTIKPLAYVDPISGFRLAQA
jgi:hypothetical protein